jgi:hypothetical protein
VFLVSGLRIPVYCNRRTFLRRAGLVALSIPTLPALGCVPDRPRQLGRGFEFGSGAITRPVLLPWSVDAVRIVTPPPELPVTYVSMGRREIYIDFDFREQVYWELRAHISVSTGVWRIPLPGDPENRPIQPGDELREFEELSIRHWDASREPTVGDIRILRGDLGNVTVAFDCAPISGGGAWFSAGPIDILQCPGAADGLCREDFMSIGTARRHPERECSGQGQPVELLTWAGSQSGA